METTGGTEKKKRRRLHNTDLRQLPNKTSTLQTVVTPEGNYAGTQVLGSTPDKAYRGLAHLVNLRWALHRAYLESALLK